MRQMVVALLIACCAASTSCRDAVSSSSFDDWADGLGSAWVRLSPAQATRTQYFSGTEQDALDRQLTMVGEWGTPVYGTKAALERVALARRWLDELRKWKLAELNPQQRTSAAIIKWMCEVVLASRPFAQHTFIFDQFQGLHLELMNVLTQSHPIRSRRDVDNYLARLALVAPLIDEGIKEARAAAAKHILPPRFIVERTLEQLDIFLQRAPRDNAFVTSLDVRIAAMPNEAMPADRAALIRAAEQIVADAVIPSYRRVRTMLQEQLPQATDNAGVWRLPQGDAFYRTALETFTTTRLSPDEIHNIGLREVTRLEGEMDALLRQLGLLRGSVRARYLELEGTLQPATSADPRAQIPADATRWVRDAERRAVRLFDLRPGVLLEVRREPAITEKTASAHYASAAPDGTRPGVFWLPLPGPRFDVLRYRSLTYHEGVPGHHFQVSLTQQSSTLPRFRRLTAFGDITAFSEGWGLYAERLADEDSWYEGDPHGRLGYLNMMLFRARRLVVDTGLHAKHWTRQQAIDYGLSPAEVDRYVVWPGQACAYMIGQLRIVELREKARAALGPRFSIKEFHDVVLRTGELPLEVLSQEVDAWISAAR